MLLVDTNALVEVLQDDPERAEWSIGQLRSRARIHELVINPVIHAEVSLSLSTLETFDEDVATMELPLRETPLPALLLAGKAYLQYLLRGGSKALALPDLFIGAHVAVGGWHLPMRDAGRLRTCTPTLEVIAP
jgi:predicted nucleic acid-binding protein